MGANIMLQTNRHQSYLRKLALQNDLHWVRRS